MGEREFAGIFFPIYDRKIAAGEIRFKEIGLPLNDFTMMCTTRGHQPADSVIRHLCDSMKLNEEERKLFLSFLQDE